MPISNYPVVTGGGAVQLLTRKAVITTSSTWTHPDGASADEPKLVLAVVFGAGGGGGPGGGASSTSNGNGSCFAGSGGGSGSIVAQELTVTGDLTVVVGAAGTGGASTANAYWPGTIGLRGGTTSLESTSPDNRLQATGGHGGNRGLGGNPGQWQGGLTTYLLPILGGLGANQGGSVTDTVGQNGSANGARDAVFPMFLAAGSGGGGGSVTPGVGNAGGTGGQSQVGNGGNGGTGVTGTGTQVGNAGTNGSGYGSGGGGGSAAWSATAYGSATGGAGGNGAPGAVIIYY